jgi:hypothetical protein
MSKLKSRIDKHKPSATADGSDCHSNLDKKLITISLDYTPNKWKKENYLWRKIEL